MKPTVKFGSFRVKFRFYATGVAFHCLPSLSAYTTNTLTYQDDQDEYPRVGRHTKVLMVDAKFLTFTFQIDLSKVFGPKVKKEVEVKPEVEASVRKYVVKRIVKHNWPPRNFWKQGQV